MSAKLDQGALFERFWRKVDRSGGPQACWPWLAGTANGYGRFKLGPRMMQAHHIAYMLAIGPIPPRHELDHVKARGCTSTLCVNPSHLEPVSHRENNRRGDGPSAQNARKTHCLHGHPLSGTNLRIKPNGQRVCRTCDTLRGRQYTQRRRKESSRP